jgi:microcystin-dependent protein
VGAPISGAGIPAGTTVSAVTSTTITLSQNATAAGSGVSIVIAPHGVGDGSTTFNVPDRRGRAGIGHDAMGTTAAGRVTSAAGGVNGTLLGASGGAQTHTLSTAEMPAHTHTATDAGHAHGYNVAVPAAGQTGGGAYTAETGNTGSTTNTGYASITIGSQGGGGAHTIMQPSIVMNYIVKT